MSSQDDGRTKIDQETASLALDATRRILASGDHVFQGNGFTDIQREKLTRQIIVEAAREHDVPVRLSQLQAAYDHLTNQDRVFGLFDMMALPMLSFDKMIEDVVVQDDGSVHVVTLFGKQVNGRDQHQVWRYEPWNLDLIGTDPKILFDLPKQTMRQLRLEDKDRQSLVEMPRTSVFSGECFRVEWKDTDRPGINVVTSETRNDVTELPNVWCQIFDLCATDKYLGFLFNLNVSGRVSRDGEVAGQITIRIRGTGANPLHEDYDRFVRAGWGLGYQMKCDDRKRVFVAEMLQKDASRRVIDHGLIIFTNTGYVFYPSVSNDTFKHAHVAMNAVWSWRPTARGIVLTRFPLP